MDNIQKNKIITVEQIPVWIKAHIFVLAIYKITNTFPKSELFGLISQIRRSSSSIPANITEGFYRNTTKELIQYLYNARGSLGESSYHLRLALDLGYISIQEYQNFKEEIDNIGKQINGWIKSLKGKIK
ncbi:MAG: four helix bundle protein [Candidatus Levybacteria bacterium]|nr:four helix bundle protein [Candidatus Levybacteria bacterium]